MFYIHICMFTFILVHFENWIRDICMQKKYLFIIFIFMLVYMNLHYFSYFFFCRSYRLAAYRSRRKFKTERRPFHYVPKGHPVLPPDGKYTTEPLTYIRSGGRDLNGNTCTGKWFSTTPTNPKLLFLYGNWQYRYFRDRASIEWSSRYWNIWMSKEIYIYLRHRLPISFWKLERNVVFMQNLNLACESVIINRFVFKSYLSFDLSLNKVT